MGMSSWALFMLPAISTAPAPEAQPVAETAPAMEIAAADVFSGESVMSIDEMKSAAGGTGFGDDIDFTFGDLALNQSQNTGIVEDNDGGVSQGVISANEITGNSGITTVFNNTGNNVVFQSSVNINIDFTQINGTGN